MRLENDEARLFAASGPERDGTSLLIFPDEELSETEAATLANNHRELFGSYVVYSAAPESKAVIAYATKLRALFAQTGLRRATVLGWGRGSAAAQALAVIDPKFVRRLVLINGSTRVKPTVLSRLIDTIETVLPLGLPLRPLSAEFDSRPFLHRIRCPTLVVLPHAASDYLAGQALYLAQKIPNAWLVNLSSITDSPLRFSSELCSLLVDFFDVPTKRPQKNSPGEILDSASIG